MRGKIGSILICVGLAIVVVATMLAGYYSSTNHADHHADAKVAVANTKLCETQVFILSAVDDLAGTAQTLVAGDTNLDVQQRAAFINQYQVKHASIQKRIVQARQSYCPTQDFRKQ